jgi:hypothetical protein|tara:strand:- start:79 stop:984 length:906 start_codon:yes stop_codon:yes gene_type:complete
MGKSKDLATLKDSGLSISGASGDILNVSSATGSEFAMRVDGNEISFKADADNDDNDSVMTFDLDGSEKMRLTDTGKLGLGTTNPVHDLQIHKATASSQARIQMTTNESGATNSDGYAVAMESGNRVYHWLYENAPMQFATNNTLNMVINADGSVTKPNQPSFMVIMTSAPTLTGTSVSTLPWNSEIFDTGSNFNTSNYRFTAPVSGKYYMHLHLEFHSDSSWTSSTWSYIGDFYVNGSQKTGADFWGHSSKYNLATNAVILDINANDYVDVRARPNNNTLRYSGDSAGSFGNCRWFGYLIG